MVHRKGVSLLAACAALACAGLVRASDFTTAGEGVTLSQQTRPIYAAEGARKPLMGAIERAGMAQQLDDQGIDVGGHIQVGWTYNFDTPDSQVNVGRVFDFEDQDPTFHQAVIYVDRAIKASSDKFDIGGRMEWMWGGDARLIHANGLFDHYGFPLFPGSPGTGDGPDEQFDLTQLYITANLPIGEGLLVTAGKFVTLLGYEYINPTGNPLYSHSYLFGFAIPFTHTGVLGKYHFNENCAITLGVVRGWDQALEDNNDMVSFTGQLAHTSENWDLYFNFITGPEQEEEEDDYRTVLDLIFVYRISDQLTLAANADYGWEEDAASDGDDAQWCGIAGYATYKISDMFALQGRIEYFSDEDAARGFDTTVYEATFGVNIRPLPADQYGSGLVVRPEIRWDGADDDIFDGGEEDTQITFGVDAIYAF
jgi:hypothetical protein